MGLWPSEGAPHRLPLSRITKVGEAPTLGLIHPPHLCSFSHCDFALLPTHTGVDKELPGKHSLGQGLTLLPCRDSFWKERNRVLSPTALFLLLPPVSRDLPCPLAGSRWPLCSQAGHSSLLLMGRHLGLPPCHQVDWNRTKPQDPPYLQVLGHVCRCLSPASASKRRGRVRACRSWG